jgi:hypothetical protein
MPPAADTFCVDGLTVKVGVPAACVTVTVCPATVAVAIRADSVVVAATVSITVPPPVPPVRLSVSHDAVLLAVHEASATDELMETVSVPPFAGAAQVGGETPNTGEPPS